MSDSNPSSIRTYFQYYMDKFPSDSPTEVLENSLDELIDKLKNLGNHECEKAYAEGKWTIKQVLGHIIETERVMSYRALRFSRNDQLEPVQFDHDQYVVEANYNDLALVDIMFELMTVRHATLSLFKNMNNEMLNRRGGWSDGEFSVEEIARIIAGHGQHHLDVILTKYL